MKYTFLALLAFASICLYSSCEDDEMGTTGPGATELHDAFAEFSTDAFTIMLDGDEVVLESTGIPNHASPYWSSTNERTINGPMGTQTTAAEAVDHPLFVAPTVTTYDQMAPGNIDDFNGSFSLTVPASPELAGSTSATGLGAIGMAISGAMIYNDEEGPGVALEDAAQSLDFNGAHTGPQSYHYHLEPISFSDDDENLVGIISDGFFIYGRKCSSTGDYPTDLDESGGHTSTTQHSTDAEYHYHIQNELYVGLYYIIFPGDYQGAPNSIN